MIPVRPLIRWGERTGFGVPGPASLKALLPQTSTWPVARSAALVNWLGAAATCLTAAGRMTDRGVSYSGVAFDPLPTWPNSLSPQAKALGGASAAVASGAAASGAADPP